MKRYRVNEVFLSLQGEGVLRGTVAAFIRFAGCNLWSGRNRRRRKDARAHDAECPLWCDTSFRDGEQMSTLKLVSAVYGLSKEPPPLVVLTGGEPLIQVDRILLERLRHQFPSAILAVETNGTVDPGTSVLRRVDHMVVSPKTGPALLKVRKGQELKVVYPAYDPLEYVRFDLSFDHWVIQPQAENDPITRQSKATRENVKAAVDFCLENPQWRLSLQEHKLLGLR